ncbi:MAG: acyl-CoA thioesterase [Bacteroidetes bacterium]|nr:acyl-CoA thioesterase [Bacteroidota bacterium]
MSNGFSHATEIRVRYAETDAMQVVYHGNYLVYFENARTEMLRAMGLPYSEVERLGLYIVVVEAHAHYKKPAYYDDLLQVNAILSELPSVKLRIDYEITRKATAELLVTGYTVHTFFNKSTNRPARPLKEFIDVVQKYFH